MNRILFDLSACQPILESKFHGGGVYGAILFERLVEIAPSSLCAFFYKSRFIDPSIIKLINDRSIACYDGDTISIEEAYTQSKADVVYTPLYSVNHENLIKSGAKYFVTIHGLRSLEMLTDTQEPLYATSFGMWIKAKLKSTAIKQSIINRNLFRYGHLLDSPNVKVITVSNHSKFSIKCYFPHIDINNVSVFYSPSTTIKDYLKYKIDCESKYYLIISANRWIKNAGRAINALDYLFDTNPGICDIVKVVGLKKNTTIYKQIKHKDKFQLLGYQTQEELEYLYSGAYAFIYPSLNEGFGYPPLEAMKYGTPVVSSPFSSIPEVCGDSVMYANPYSVEEIATRILQLEDRETYEELKNKGYSRYIQIEKKQKKDLDLLCNMLLGDCFK